MRLHLDSKHLRGETLTDVKTKVLGNKLKLHLYNHIHTKKKGKIFKTDVHRRPIKKKSSNSTELTKPTPQ